VAVLLAPFSGADAELFFEQLAENAVRLVAAGQRHLHHFGVGMGQQLAGFGQTQFGLFFPK
jgi:hypothetical protein